LEQQCEELPRIKPQQEQTGQQEQQPRPPVVVAIAYDGQNRREVINRRPSGSLLQTSKQAPAPLEKQMRQQWA